MKSIMIVSAQEDFSFPLAEAARKQIFYRARTYQQEGDQASILIITPNLEDEFEQDGINIQLTTRNGLYRKRWLLRESDRVEYWGTTGLIALKIGMLSRAGNKRLIVTDGGVVSTGARASLRKLAASRLTSFYDEIDVFTEYQRKLLLKMLPKGYHRRINKIKPVVEPVSLPKVERAADPTILYMGHLSRFKGVDLLLKLFEDLLPEQPKLRLILCHNGLTYDEECERDVKELARRFPEQVIVKGKVDPYEQLARAHILIHPIKQSEGTFAFPMALWEAVVTGTPFISTRLDGVAEFFDDSFLSPVDDYLSLMSLTRGMLMELEKYRSLLNKNHERLVDQVMQCEVEEALGQPTGEPGFRNGNGKF